MKIRSFLNTADSPLDYIIRLIILVSPLGIFLTVFNSMLSILGVISSPALSLIGLGLIIVPFILGVLAIPVALFSVILGECKE